MMMMASWNIYKLLSEKSVITSNDYNKDPSNHQHEFKFYTKRELTLNAKYPFVCPGWRSVIVHRDEPSLPSAAGSRVIVNWRLDSGSISSAWGSDDMVVMFLGVGGSIF